MAVIQENMEVLLKISTRGVGEAPPTLPDNGELGEGHRGQGEAIREGDGLHGPRTLGGVVLQALSHILLL